MKVPVLVLMLALVAGCAGEPPGLREPEPREADEVGLDDLPTGAPPRIGYVTGTTYVDGGTRTRIDLPRRVSVTSVVPFDGGILVGDDRWFEGTNGLHLVDGGRTTPMARGLVGTSGTGAASPDGTSIAWATFAGPETGSTAPLLLHRRSPDGETVQELAVPANENVVTAVVGFLDGDVVYQRGFIHGVYRSDLCSPPRRIRGLQTVSSIDERGGLLAGSTDLDGYRSAVLDGRDGDVLWSARLALGPFNPSGTRLVAHHRGDWSIVDATTGRRLARLEVPDGVRLDDVAWEDDESLLAVASQGRRVAVVRFDLRGRAELAAPVVRRGRGAGYVLTHQP